MILAKTEYDFLYETYGKRGASRYDIPGILVTVEEDNLVAVSTNTSSLAYIKVADYGEDVSPSDASTTGELKRHIKEQSPNGLTLNFPVKKKLAAGRYIGLFLDRVKGGLFWQESAKGEICFHGPSAGARYMVDTDNANKFPNYRVITENQALKSDTIGQLCLGPDVLRALAVFTGIGPDKRAVKMDLRSRPIDPFIARQINSEGSAGNEILLYCMPSKIEKGPDGPYKVPQEDSKELEQENAALKEVNEKLRATLKKVCRENRELKTQSPAPVESDIQAKLQKQVAALERELLEILRWKLRRGKRVAA